MQQKTAVIWFTNNLRVRDNKALYEACSQYSSVIGVYCFDKNLFNSSQFGFKKIEKFRAQFLIESVSNLSKNLKKLNIPLFTYFDQPENKFQPFVNSIKPKHYSFKKSLLKKKTIYLIP